MAEKFDELDPVLNTPVRLAIVSVLIKVRQADFNTLMEITQTTQGNMSHQLKRLNDEGYISTEKSFKGNYPLTTCKLTAKGKKAFENYVESIKKIPALMSIIFLSIWFVMQTKLSALFTQ